MGNISILFPQYPEFSSSVRLGLQGKILHTSVVNFLRRQFYIVKCLQEKFYFSQNLEFKPPFWYFKICTKISKFPRHQLLEDPWCDVDVRTSWALLYRWLAWPWWTPSWASPSASTTSQPRWTPTPTTPRAAPPRRPWQCPPHSPPSLSTWGRSPGAASASRGQTATNYLRIETSPSRTLLLPALTVILNNDNSDQIICDKVKRDFFKLWILLKWLGEMLVLRYL